MFLTGSFCRIPDLRGMWAEAESPSAQQKSSQNFAGVRSSLLFELLLLAGGSWDAKLPSCLSASPSASGSAALPLGTRWEPGHRLRARKGPFLAVTGSPNPHHTDKLRKTDDSQSERFCQTQAGFCHNSTVLFSSAARPDGSGSESLAASSSWKPRRRLEAGGPCRVFLKQHD